MLLPSTRIRLKRKFIALGLLLLLVIGYTTYSFFSLNQLEKKDARGDKNMDRSEKIFQKRVTAPMELILEKSEEIPQKKSLNYNVHIFYYPWYGSPQFDQGSYYHWNGEILPHWDKIERQKWPTGNHVPPEDLAANYYPKLGPYSSRDKSVLEQHMEWIAATGTGVISVSWYPPAMADQMGKPWDDLMPAIMDIADRFELKVCFHIEPYKDRNILNLKENLQYIIDAYGKHRAFYRHEYMGRKKPLFYIYDSYLIPLEDWKSLLLKPNVNSVRGTSLDAFYIGLLVKEQEKTVLASSGFDGFYTYFAADSFSYGSTWRNWRYLQKFARKQTLIFIPSVGPGYIDERVRPWNKANIRSRKDGEYYGQYWQAAIESGAKAVSITSFNEWHEGSQVEPAITKETSDGYKYLDYSPNSPEFYLELTKIWVDKFTEEITKP